MQLRDPEKTTPSNNRYIHALILVPNTIVQQNTQSFLEKQMIMQLPQDTTWIWTIYKSWKEGYAQEYK